MGVKERQMLELRSLRNAAKGLLRDDVAFLKGERGEQGIAPRLMEGATHKAREAADKADEHKVKIGTGLALGVGAFAAWIFRSRIEKAFDDMVEFIMDQDDSIQGDKDALPPTETEQISE